MRTFAAHLIVACLVVSAVLLAQAVNITGTWLFSVTTGQGSGNPTITFKQDGEKLTGHYNGTLGEADFTGTVKGTAVTFSFNVSAQGTEVDVVYTGQVEGDAMKGAVSIAGGQVAGSFTAKKQQ